jgi:hypothetical protein
MSRFRLDEPAAVASFRRFRLAGQIVHAENSSWGFDTAAGGLLD